MSPEFTARLRVMTDSSRNDLVPVIDALPSELREPVSLWLKRLQERYDPVAIPAGMTTTLVRTVAASEFAANLLLKDWPWFLDSAAQLSEVPDEDYFRSLVSDVAGGDLEPSAAKKAIRRFRHRTMFRLLWREMLGDAALDDTLNGLSDLADSSLEAASKIAVAQMEGRYGHVRDAGGNPVPLVILGMGKLGGRELNFSSDVDLIFLYPEGRESDGSKCLSAQEYFARLSRHVIALVDEVTADGFAFRVDTRLRPFGDSGPPVVSFAALE